MVADQDPDFYVKQNVIKSDFTAMWPFQNINICNFTQSLQFLFKNINVYANLCTFSKN